MSESNDRQSVDKQQTPQARSRRRFRWCADGWLARERAGRRCQPVCAGAARSRLVVWSRARSGGHFRHAAYDPEMVRTRVEFATDWILSRVEASDAQHQQVKAIVQATVQDLAQMRKQHHQNRQALVQALAQPTIDRTTRGHSSRRIAAGGYGLRADCHSPGGRCRGTHARTAHQAA